VKSLSNTVIARLQADMRLPDLRGTRYHLVRYVAGGGMGRVWLAEDTVLNRRVALKVLDLVVAADDLDVRLLREARALAALEHPGIVPVHDAGTLPDGRAFYCMKYVEGQTLTKHISILNLADKLRLLERIAEPLDFAHARGFIHRDLKPDNIMIGAFGEVLVMDWGLAKCCATNLKNGETEIDASSQPTQKSSFGTCQGSVLGTRGYMSPEQARGDIEVDQHTDIYSLGAILAFMLTGATPSELSLSNAGVPRQLRAICEKAMAADASARYQSAREMTTDITHYLNGESVSACPENLIVRSRRVFARHRTAIVLVAAYLTMRLMFILLSRH